MKSFSPEDGFQQQLPKMMPTPFAAPLDSTAVYLVLDLDSQLPVVFQELVVANVETHKDPDDNADRNCNQYTATLRNRAYH